MKVRLRHLLAACTGCSTESPHMHEGYSVRAAASQGCQSRSLAGDTVQLAIGMASSGTCESVRVKECLAGQGVKNKYNAASNDVRCCGVSVGSVASPAGRGGLLAADRGVPQHAEGGAAGDSHGDVGRPRRCARAADGLWRRGGRRQARRRVL